MSRLFVLAGWVFAAAILPVAASPLYLRSGPAPGARLATPERGQQRPQAPAAATKAPQSAKSAKSANSGQTSAARSPNTPSTGEGTPAAANPTVSPEEPGESATSPDAAPGQQTPASKPVHPQRAAEHLNLIAGFAFVGVVLSLALAVFAFLQYKELQDLKRFTQDTRSAPPAKQIAALSRRVDELERSSPATSMPVPRDKRLETLVRDMEERVSAVQHEVSRLQVSVHEGREYATQSALRLVDQLRSDLNGIADAITDDNTGVSSAPAAEADARSVEGAGEALASVVNAWIGMRSGDRAKLVSTAERAGLREPRLGALDGGPASSASNFEITLNLGGDGPWIAVPVPGSADLWAAPADAQFMTMGAAPMLLSQLFRGMDGAQQGFRFAAIYRCCRLRPVPGRANAYKVQERGLLQLEGAPAPGERRPADLDAFIGAAAQRATAAKGRPIGQLLSGWMKVIAAQTERHTRELANLQEAVTRQLSLPAQSVSGAEVNRLSVDLNQLRRDHEQLALELRRRNEQGREALSVRTPAPAPAADVRPRTAQASPDVQRSTPEIQPQQVRPASEAPAVALASDHSRALLWAGSQPEADPDSTEVPSQELYVRRLQVLAKALSRAGTETQADIAHVVKRPGAATLELHETEPTQDGMILCRVCHERQTWQLAVVAAGNSQEVQLFLPVGTLAKSNYAAGYSALVEDVPSGSFSVTAGQRPASVALAGDGRNYTVVRKLLLNGTASPAGRA